MSTAVVSTRFLQERAKIVLGDRYQDVISAVYQWRFACVREMNGLVEGAHGRDMNHEELERMGDLQAELLHVGHVICAINADRDKLGIYVER